MLLAVENPDTGFLEVAMLLDEPPSCQYMSGSIGGQPWRRDGPLARAALTAEAYGYAWLTIVYHKDDVRTWGKRRVKVEAGGRLYATTRTKLGVDTSELRLLQFETVAPSLFRPLHGHPTSLPYKVINDAQMTLDPDLETDYGDAHELLGFREQGAGNASDTPSETGKFVRADLGCRIVWTDERQYGETWFLQDEGGFSAYRFELTEYQRRPFVADILARLGFVKPSMRDQVTDTAAKARCQIRGQVQNICNSMRVITTIINNHTPQKGVQFHRANNGSAATDNGNAPSPLRSGKRSSNAEAAEAAAAAAAASLAATGINIEDDDDLNNDKATASESGVEDAMETEGNTGEFHFGGAESE